jgi:uncharacterized protein (TIGR02145 family)
MKAVAGNSDLWKNGNLENNSEFGTSGFNALPAGYRTNYDGNFNYMGNNGYFWSSTGNNGLYAWYRKLTYSNSDVYRSYSYKQGGFSIRCLGD